MDPFLQGCKSQGRERWLLPSLASPALLFFWLGQSSWRARVAWYGNTRAI